MSKTELAESPAIARAALAAALAALRTLLLNDFVKIAMNWHDSGSGPGTVTPGRVVEVSIFDDPAALDAILRGMSELDGPTYWEGNHYGYNEWRGYLLTMPLLVSQRIDLRPAPAPAAADFPPPPAGADRYACADHPDFVPDSLQHLREHIETLHADELAGAAADPEPAGPDVCSCWATSRNGCPQHYIRDDELPEPELVRPWVPQYTAEDARPLLELALDERFGPARGPVAPIEIIGEPGQSVDQLVERFGKVQGVVVVPGEPVHDDGSVDAAWSRYARGRALHYFGDRRYPSMAAALDALRYWPGFDILREGDAEIVAGALVDPPRTPEPPVAGPFRRLFTRPETAR